MFRARLELRSTAKCLILLSYSKRLKTSVTITKDLTNPLTSYSLIVIGGFFMKKCNNKDCTQVNPQPYDNFFRDSANKSDGRYGTCKVCKTAKIYAWRKANPKKYNSELSSWRKKNPDKNHATEIKRAYGISIEEYNELLTKQACKCAICDKPHDPSLKRGRLYVDHCHKGPKARSGQKANVRGLLCGGCNSALGYFNDDIEIMKKAMAYINKI